MTTMTPNLPELKRLNMWVQEQDQLEEDARIWNQDNWVEIRKESPLCQTAYCVAGAALVRAGHKFVRATSGGKASFMELDGQYIETDDVAYKAADILGLDEMVADDLFEATNTADDVDREIRRIFAEADVDYDATEPAPNFEIEIKAAEAVRPQLRPMVNA